MSVRRNGAMIRHLIVTAALAAGIAGCAAPAGREAAPRTTPTAGAAVLAKRFDGLERPLLVTAPANDERLFVVEQTGTVRVAPGPDAPLDAAPWLDLRDDVTTDGGEQGLLGLAFHPDFATNGRVYVNYTARGEGREDGRTVVEEITVDPAATGAAQVRSRRPVLEIPQPYSNHNGGNIVFGPDGRLWIGTGDGGSADDPDDLAQDPDSLLGKMLRLDVDTPGAEPEIWADGLRNPWRYSFDPATGDLWIGDVGQNAVEEVDVVRAAAEVPAGGDFGWPATEGDRRNRDTPPTQTVAPVVTYGRDGGNCSVTGGIVYRGPTASVDGVGDLAGRYVYGDYCSGRIWALDAGRPGTPVEINERIGAPKLSISSFGTDAAGRLYVIDGGGSVWALTTT